MLLDLYGKRTLERPPESFERISAHYVRHVSVSQPINRGECKLIGASLDVMDTLA